MGTPGQWTALLGKLKPDVKEKLQAAVTAPAESESEDDPAGKQPEDEEVEVGFKRLQTVGDYAKFIGAQLLVVAVVLLLDNNINSPNGWAFLKSENNWLA